MTVAPCGSPRHDRATHRRTSHQHTHTHIPSQVARARAVGSTDAARLRAWLYLQLNRRCLQIQLASLLADTALLAMM